MNIRVTLRDPRGNLVERRVLGPLDAGAFAGKFVVTHGADPEGAEELEHPMNGGDPEFSWRPQPGSVEFEPTDDPADRYDVGDPWTAAEVACLADLPLPEAP